jgi:DNA polymerase I
MAPLSPESPEPRAPSPSVPSDPALGLAAGPRERLFLIDGYALIYRAFFAFVNRPLTNSRGENTSAPWGFANFLLKIREEHAPEYLAVVFDAGSSQREVLYPAYKATREKMPDELEASLPRIRELVAGFQDEVVELEGYEADDVIGTLARQAEAHGIDTVIVSGDKDFYQLIRPGVSLLNPGRGGPTGVQAEWVDPSNASERLGVPPSQVADYLALIGDASDNVPGAPGIGPKTAVELLEKHGSLETLLERARELPGKRAREALTEHADLVRLSKTLVTILTDLPITLDLERLRVREPDRARLRALFVELEFRTLIDRFTDENEVPAAPDGGAVEYTTLSTVEAVEDAVRTIRALGAVAVDTETTSPEPMRADLVGISLSWAPGQGVYLPFGHRAPGSAAQAEAGGTGTSAEGVGDLFSGLDLPPPPGPQPDALEDGPLGTPADPPEGARDPSLNLPPLLDPRLRALVEMLEDPAVEKTGQNLKYDLLVLRRAGVTLRGIRFDTMIASYVLEPGRRSHGLDALSTDLLGYTPISYASVTGRGRTQISFAEVPLEVATPYAAEDADLTLRLRARFDPELEETGLQALFQTLEMPLLTVLAQMEWNGIRIDVPFFHEMGRRLARELEALQDDVWKEAGVEFNLNSNPQLREILYERLGLPVLRRTKTGPSTDASVLEELAALGHPLPRLLMEYRQLEKLRSTYVDSLPKLVNPETGRIHTSFNQTVAATGRLSSSDPNLQNIPIRTPLGREIRKGFVPERGHVFLAADYSQIELRILAHVSGDAAFVTAFREDRDVHRQTASVIFDVPLDAVTPEMRARAKTINFATLYGQGEFSLGRQLGISRDEAADFIQRYFDRFSGVRAFLDAQVTMAREKGYVETLSGRRRQIPELQSRNWNVRQFGERIAQNTPIQGTAADLIKIAMLRVQGGLETGGFRARLLLQVHDELVLEVPHEELEAVESLVVREMEGAMALDVPLKVDVGVGGNWYECK